MTASLATDMSRLGVTMHPESRLGKGCLANKGYVPGTFPLLWDISKMWFTHVHPQKCQVNKLDVWGSHMSRRPWPLQSAGLSSGSTQVAKAQARIWAFYPEKMRCCAAKMAFKRSQTRDFKQQTQGDRF